MSVHVCVCVCVGACVCVCVCVCVELGGGGDQQDGKGRGKESNEGRTGEQRKREGCEQRKNRLDISQATPRFGSRSFPSLIVTCGHAPSCDFAPLQLMIHRNGSQRCLS